MKEKLKQEMAGKAFYESADKVITVKRQETLEEAAERIYDDNLFDYKKYRDGFIKGAEWKEEQIPSIIEQKWLEYRDNTNNEDAWCFKEWLVEQFKNN